jgi:hypothetical protein
VNSPRALARTLLVLLVAATATAARPADAPRTDAAAVKELDAALRAILTTGAIASARTGMLVADVETGQVL